MQCPKCSYEPTLSETQASPDACPSCGVIYAKVGKGDQDPKESVGKNSSGRRVYVWVVFFFVCFLAGIGAKFGYEKYQVSKAINAARPSVKITTAYMVQQIGLHESGSNITFGEYFERSKNAISEIDKLIIGLNGIDVSGARSELMVAEKYMETVRETIRDMSAVMRASMNASSASDIADEAYKESLDTSNEYTAAYEKDRYRKALDDQEKALKKILELKTSMRSRIAILKESANEVSGIYGKDSVVGLEDIGKIGN